MAFTLNYGPDSDILILMQSLTRKIIHIDMDCFYAAVEIRDNPALADKPVAVGAPASQRGVICTCNYIARQFGVHSAMPTATALRHCKDLVLLPVNMAKYKEVAEQIHAVFRQYTDLVEPLALDEAYLDVTHCREYQGSATRIAEAIRSQIWETQRLVASAGVAPNKFLAKIGSGWNKPNGLFVIRPQEVSAFVKQLKVEHLFGVGKVTARKFAKLQLATCGDLQKLSLPELIGHFGKLGERLYEQCRGIDPRPVNPYRIRKSLSVEETFAQDISEPEQCYILLQKLHQKLQTRIQSTAPEQCIRNQFIKIKFHDFTATSMETLSQDTDFRCYQKMFIRCYERFRRPIRLLGIGVSFKNDRDPFPGQESLF